MNPKVLKTIALIAASALSAIIFAFLLKSVIALVSLSSVLLLVLGGAVFLAIFLMMTLLLNLVLIAVVGSFRPSLMLAGALVLAFLWMVQAYYGGRSELKNNLEIHFWQNGRAVISKASSALALFAVVLYLTTFNFNNPAVIKGYFVAMIQPIEPIMATYFPVPGVSNIIQQATDKSVNIFYYATVGRFLQLPDILQNVILFVVGIIIFLFI